MPGFSLKATAAIALLLLAAAGPARAQTATETQTPVEAQTPAETQIPAETQVPAETLQPLAQTFPDWLVEFRSEAEQRGISGAILDEALNGIEPIPRIIELDRNQPEFTLTFREYITRVAPERRISIGRKKLAENRDILDTVARKYGVPPHVIVALWGMETDFGRLTGGFKVVPALATLAYDGRRSDFFRKELMNALTILSQGHITAAKMIGSWAGAMGQCQFMPSSFLNFAVDGNNDGRKDIWKTPSDIFSSAANLLEGNGWQRGWTWGRPVRLPANFDLRVEGLETSKPLADWQALGVRRIDGRNLPRATVEASLVMPDGADGGVFLVYDNFHAFLRWNRSNYFALTAGYLADRIAGKNTKMFAK